MLRTDGSESGPHPCGKKQFQHCDVPHDGVAMFLGLCVPFSLISAFQNRLNCRQRECPWQNERRIPFQPKSRERIFVHQPFVLRQGAAVRGVGCDQLLVDRKTIAEEITWLMFRAALALSPLGLFLDLPHSTLPPLNSFL